MKLISTLCEGLDHPEGVAWANDGYLYSGGEAGQIYRIDPMSGQFSEIANTGGAILGVTVNRDGAIYVCDRKRRAVIRLDRSGFMSVVSAGSQRRPFVMPNYAVFTRSGDLLVSDSGDWLGDDGCIHLIRPSGETTVWSENAPAFTNGLALAPDARSLAVVESTGPRISRIEINDDGSAGRTSVIAELPGTVPDGVAYDAEGRLYVACYRPDQILRIDCDGRITVFADDFQGTALGAPTNIAFGGTGHRTLYIANLGRWHIATATVDVPGLPLASQSSH